MITRRTALALLGSTMLPAIGARRRSRAGLSQAASSRPASCRRWRERLPGQPRVVNVAAMGREPGQYGGIVRTLIGGQKDIRLMTIYGYARLVGYDEKLNFQPDILESFDVGRGPHLHASRSATATNGRTARR